MSLIPISLISLQPMRMSVNIWWLLLSAASSLWLFFWLSIRFIAIRIFVYYVVHRSSSLIVYFLWLFLSPSLFSMQSVDNFSKRRWHVDTLLIIFMKYKSFVHFEQNASTRWINTRISTFTSFFIKIWAKLCRFCQLIK